MNTRVHSSIGIHQVFSKSCLVNLISKDTHLVFSVYYNCSHLDGQPQLLDFIEGLQIYNDDTELLYQDRTTWFRDCSVREVDRHLQDKLDGTFLVRPHKPPDTPYCVCVMYVLLYYMFTFIYRYLVPR